MIKNINPMDKTIEQKKAIFNRLGLEVIIYENNYQLFLKKISVSEYNDGVGEATCKLYSLLFELLKTQKRPSKEGLFVFT